MHGVDEELEAAERPDGNGVHRKAVSVVLDFRQRDFLSIAVGADKRVVLYQRARWHDRRARQIHVGVENDADFADGLWRGPGEFDPLRKVGPAFGNPEVGQAGGAIDPIGDVRRCIAGRGGSDLEARRFVKGIRMLWAMGIKSANPVGRIWHPELGVPFLIWVRIFRKVGNMHTGHAAGRGTELERFDRAVTVTIIVLV
jgi:hypothetical protein